MNQVNPYTLPIILASTSPRRKQLLSLANIDFDVLAVDIDETPRIHEPPTTYIQRMVTDKTIGASKRIAMENDRYAKHNEQACLVITADTIGVLSDGQQILVKPHNQQQALAMWRKMSATTHDIWTAVQLSVIDTQGNLGRQINLLQKTKVEFIALSDKQMLEYWQTGEPSDKAGGYAIQGRGAAWVKAIYGSYTNVVGLPLAQTVEAVNTLQSCPN